LANTVHPGEIGLGHLGELLQGGIHGRGQRLPSWLGQAGGQARGAGGPAARSRGDQAGEARQREPDHQQQVDLEPVGERVGVFERVGGVGIEEPAAVGTQVLDRLLRGDWPAGDRLVVPGQRGDRVRTVQAM
jgi:hypothetical protein